MASAGLNPYQIARYRTRGYVAVRGRFDADDVALWQAECDRLWQALAVRPGDNRVQFREHANGTAIADRIDPLLDVSPVFRRVARDARIVAAVDSALGGTSKVIKAKLITKRPGTHGYGLHQDFPYWQHMGLLAESLLTVQVAIDAADETNGGVELWPGLHREILPPAPENHLDVAPGAVADKESELIPLDTGDLLLFHSLAPHRSAPNRSKQSRRAVFVTYGKA